MQTTTGLYRSLLHNPDHQKETKLSIAGNEYREDQIAALSVSGGLFSGDTLTIGGCVAREIDLEISAGQAIPRMAKIKVYIRLVLRDPLTDEVTQASEWLPKGVFYIDTRSEDPEAGTVAIHGYDAMLKAEQPYTPDGALSTWPRPSPDVARDLAALMGVEIDPRSGLDSTLKVPAKSGYSVREVLGGIAAAHAGNWIMTDTGKLRLVRLTDTPPESFALIDEAGRVITFGGVGICVG